MIVVIRLVGDPADEADPDADRDRGADPDRDPGAGLLAAGVTALRVLAARPGYVSGRLGRASDDPSQWVLVTEWRDVGSYRRALGNYDVKVQAQALLSRAIDSASAFEVLAEAGPGAEPVIHPSDLDKVDRWPPTETTLL